MTSHQLARRLTGVASPASSGLDDRRAGSDAERLAPHGRRRDARAAQLLLAGDVLGLGIAAILAQVLVPEAVSNPISAVLAVALWLAIFRAFGLYDRDLSPLRPRARDDVPGLLSAALVASLAIATLHEAGFYEPGVPGRMAALAALSVAAVLVLRALTRRAAGVILGPERVLLVGDPDSVEVLARIVAARPDLGLETAGIVARDGKPRAAASAPVSRTPDRADLSAIVAEHGVNHVLVTASPSGTARLLEELRPCRRRGLKVSVMSPIADAPTARAADDGRRLSALGAEPPRLSPLARAAKRTLDVIGSGVALTLAAPALLVIAVAVKRDSPGPVLFRQERIGHRGRSFRLVKFRTMVVGAEAMTERLRAASLDPDWLMLERDPRVTRLGRMLRLWSLDELPQLWNVLRGDMSLVGPRPLILSEDDRVRDWARARGELPPGLTGLWQVTGRTGMSFEEMIRLDCVYAARWSLWGDLSILLRTVPAVLSRRGAN